MANIGRFACVAVPFILTLLALVFLLVAALGGVTNKDLYMFQVNITELEVNPISIKSIVTRDILDTANGILDDAGDVIDDVKDSDIGQKADDIINGDGTQSSNITNKDLGLADVYEVNLWGYCTHDVDDNNKECTKPKFDWASAKLNSSENFIDNIGAATSQDVEIPDEVQKGLDVFKYVTKWTEVAYIIALVSLGVQLFLGLFAQCSRGFSCVVFLVSGVSTIATIAAASLSTAMAVVVVGTVESTAKFYGVRASFQSTFLGIIWTAVAFTLAAAFFWMFTICCCAPDHKSRKSKSYGSRGSTDGEKLIGGSNHAYRPVSEQSYPGNNPNYYQPTSYGQQQYGAPRSDLAYEPFSHR